MILRVRWLLAVGAFVALLASGVWLWLRDDPPPVDQDLRLFGTEVAEETNGFRILNAIEDFYFPIDEEAAEIAGKATDQQVDQDSGNKLEANYVSPAVLERIDHSNQAFDSDLARRVVDENDEALHLLDDALARPDFKVTGEASYDAGVLRVWPDLATLVCCRSRLHAEAGSNAKALEDALRLMHLGKRIQASQGPLRVYMMGFAFHAQGSHLLRYLSSRLQVSPEVLKAFNAKSSALYPEPSALADAYRAEYTDLIASYSRGDDGLPGKFWQNGWSRLTFKPNRTRRFVAQELRLLISAVAKPAQDRSSSYAEKEYAITSGGLGTEAILLLRCQRALHFYDHMSLQLSAARTMLALKCWHTIHETLPGTLYELVPEYLERVPLDPFDGKPLRYSPQRKLLYSGKAEPGLEPGTHYTFPIELGALVLQR